MDLFKVVLSPRAESQLSEYIDYIHYVLLNESAARSVYQDAQETLDRLSKIAASLKYCGNPDLKKYNYRKINFSHHQYFMLYRVEDKTAYVDAIYHQQQDYENYFSESLEEK